MKWKQINSGLWKADEGGYEIEVSAAPFSLWQYKITDSENGTLLSMHTKSEQSAKQAAEEAYLKLVK